MELFIEKLKEYIVSNLSVNLNNFGNFKMELTNAEIKPIIHEFFPPETKITFIPNNDCNTDENFIVFISQQLNISKDDAILKINDFINTTKEKTEQNRSLELKNLGILKYDNNNNLIFEQDENLKLDILSFGLPEFKLEQPKTEKKINIEKTSTSKKTRKKKDTNLIRKRRRKNQITAFIIFLLIFAGATTLYYIDIDKLIYEKPAKKTAKLIEEEITEVIDEEVTKETTIVETSKEEIKEKITEVKENENLKYFIVADCFRNINYAEQRVKDLQKKGHQALIGGKSKGLNVVAYSGYSDKQTAEKELEKIRKTENRNAWLFENNK